MKQNLTKLQYQAFDWLRFPLIILVIYNHSIGEPINYNDIHFSQLTGRNCYDLLKLSVLIIMQVAVPCFFFISGYLFFNKLKEWDVKIYAEKLKKRAKTILIPFLIWNTLSILYKVQDLYRVDGISAVASFINENGYWRLYWDSLSWGHDVRNWFGIHIPLTSPDLGSLWYLRDLMVMMVISPCFYYLFKYTKKWGLILLLIYYLTGIGTNPPGFSATAIFFFGAGTYFNLKQIDTTKWTWNYRYMIYAITVFLWFADISVLGKHYGRAGTFIEPIFVVFGCISMFNLAADFIIHGLKIPTLLGQSSFFIYVSHMVVITNYIVRYRQLLLGMNNPWLMSLGYLSSAWIIAATCLIFYIILHKFTPKLCYVLAGGR